MTETTAQQVQRPRRDWLRRLIRGGLALVLLPPLLLTLLLLGLDTHTGRGWLVQTVNRSATVNIVSLEGSLWRQLTLNGLRIDTPTLTLDADRLELDWTPYSLLLKRVHLSSLKAGRIDLAFKPAPPDRPATEVPRDLRLPLAITLDSAEIASLQLLKSGPVFSDIRFSLSSTGRHHRLDLAQLVAQQGKAQARIEIDGQAPFAASGHFDFRGEVEGSPIHTQGSFKGNLRALDLAARVDNPKAQGRVDARLDLFAPYAYQMLREGRIELDHINPARLLADLPQAELNIRLDLHPAGDALAQGVLEISNQQAGAINAGRLPLESLRANLAYVGNELQFSSLDARLGGGRIRGHGKIGDGQLTLAFDIATLNLAQLWKRQPATALGGTLAVHGPWLAPDIQADLTDSQRQVSLKTDLGWINPQTERRLQIRQLHLQRGASQLSAQGEFSLDSKKNFKLAGDFNRVNPAEYANLPAGALSGNFKAEGYLQPRPVLALDYRLSNSRFNGEILQGQGRLRLEESRLADADLWLMLGRNRLDARGALGNKNDALQLSLDWPTLHSLGKHFAGSAQGQVRVSGTLTDPVLAGQIKMADLLTPFGFAVKNARVEAHLQRGMQAPLRLQVEAAQLRQGNVLLERIQAQVEGSRSQHAGSLLLNGTAGAIRPLQLQMNIAGGLDAAWRWQGQLQQFHLQGPQTLRLLEPVDLQAGSTSVSLGNSHWKLGKTQLQLQQTRWQPGRIDTHGKFSQLPLAEWLNLAGVRDYASDLALTGHWQLRLDQNLRDLNGGIQLERESGDHLWRGSASNRIPFELREAALRLDVQHNRVEIKGQIDSARYGKVSLGGNTRIDPVRMQLAEGAKLSLYAKGELPQLAALNPLVGPDLQLAGRVAFDVRREGTQLAGSIQGDALGIRDLASGLNLKDGTLRMTLAEQRILLQQATFKGGQGNLRAEGVLDLHQDTPSGQARVEAHRLTLFSRADMLLVLSGQGELSSKKGQISVSGKLRADQGDIEYRNADIPKLSSDVVILGRERAKPKALPALALSVDVDLGNDFRFRGYGLDAKLNGLLRLRAQPSQPLSANGVVQVKEGSYRAWGQRLEIERGQLSFQGPVENPGLNILAMRRNQTVEAGVSVLGSAMNPRVQLYSEPSVPDTEKLAWLLFGHGTDGMEKSDSALLLQAAHSLLSGNDGSKGLTDSILNTVGVDDIGMRSKRETDGKSTQIVTVSKQLGRNFRVSLEKSLNGLRDGVQFTLQLSRRWSLVSRVGNDESSAGATYTIQFE